MTLCCRIRWQAARRCSAASTERPLLEGWFRFIVRSSWGWRPRLLLRQATADAMPVASGAASGTLRGDGLSLEGGGGGQAREEKRDRCRVWCATIGRTPAPGWQRGFLFDRRDPLWASGRAPPNTRRSRPVTNRRSSSRCARCGRQPIPCSFREGDEWLPHVIARARHRRGGRNGQAAR